jgi:hypothetical protein
MRAPEHYQRELALAGGTNPHGQANFILWWTGIPRTDAPVLPIADRPSWALLEWHPATDAGAPATWPGAELGPYPHRGFYDVLQTFWEGAEPACLDSAPLNLSVLRRMVWVALNIRAHNLAKRMAAIKDMRTHAATAQRERIADCLQDAMPAFGEAASYRLQQGASTALAQRIEQIRKNLAHSDTFSSRMPRATSIVPSA